MSDAQFLESFGVTLRFAAAVVSFKIVLGVGLALLLDCELRGMSAMRKIFILPTMIAPIVVGLMWRNMYHTTVGVFDRTLKSLGFDPIPWLSDGSWAFASVVIADVWQWTPLIFILSLAALQSLPRSSMEAAHIDRATAWQTIVYVKLPLKLPVLIVTALLRLIDAFKVLEVILVMTNGDPGLSTEILALRISRTASEFGELGSAAAISNLLLILLMVLTLGMFAYTKIAEIRARRQP
jgi:multiple sugar transport system permease protein